MSLDNIYTIVYGVYIMKRYQVYLHPQSVAILDDVEEHTHISRSQLIREAIDRLAQQLGTIMAEDQIAPTRPWVFDQLIGLITSKQRRITNYAERPDRFYLED